MRKRVVCYFLLFVISSVFIFGPVFAEEQPQKRLELSVSSPGKVHLDGDIARGNRIRLYSREYSSTVHKITDKLILEATADADGPVDLQYSIWAAPVSETQIIPDFEYEGREIIIKGLYAVLSEGASEVQSNLVYTDCTLDTGVVNQYWCSLAGSTACGTAAGVIAMQTVYPASGDVLFTRLNEMRKYSLIGEDFSTGPAEYYLCGYQISNTVNKYVSDELSAGLVMTDHRTADKTTEETLIELLSTGRPAIIEVCYLLGSVTRDFQGISHWITINGFTLDENGYTFRFADSITVSYRSISSEMLEISNTNVSYGDSGYIPDRYIGAFEQPLFSIE